jgi:neurotransmitter:Na+ symporter, NSS family
MTSGRQGEGWTSRWGFLLATVGSAVGLGSIWKFPYMVGENGGGAFVLVYLAALAVIVFPILLAEFVIGRRGGQSAVGSLQRVASETGATRAWGFLGMWSVAAGFLILSFYSVIGGWTIAYVPIAASGGFEGLNASEIGALFQALLADPSKLFMFHTIFMGLTAIIVALGVTNGLERAVTILMPLLFIIMIGLVIYAALTYGLGRSAEFMFTPDMSKITPKVVLDAIGLGFFSISVGMGVMITYAAYTGRDVNLSEIAIATIAGDTVVSFLAGFAIFPLVFASGLDPAGGPGLMFVTLPVAFATMEWGTAVGAAFFVLLLVSALASALSLLELIVSYAVERGVARPIAALGSGAICWVLGLATVYSFNVWAQWFPLAGVAGFEKKTVFDLIDFFTSNIMLPVGGILIAVFAGWVMSSAAVKDELGLRGGLMFELFRFLLRIVCPLALGVVLFAGLMVGGGGGG